MIDKSVYEIDYIRELQKNTQLFDTAILSDYLSDYALFAKTYQTAVAEETVFRGKSWSMEDVLRDTVRACVSIISRGNVDKNDYVEYLHGIKSLKNHILLSDYNTDDATWKACKVMYLSSCLISGNPFRQIANPEEYITTRLEGDEYKKLSYVRKQRTDAYKIIRNRIFVFGSLCIK